MVRDQTHDKLDLLVREKPFPSLPEAWTKGTSEKAVSWYARVRRMVADLKTCDIEGFKDICGRLSGELKVQASYV